jgi:hypothetical protein
MALLLAAEEGKSVAVADIPKISNFFTKDFAGICRTENTVKTEYCSGPEYS